ncbi:PucR family transcriptional regulator [Egicoccus sp. AB-alg6-2]|uniref:PucR family transcriptional regulator n=1 Tax=Egicoccus sp. AB-alg6-2 TaxID=3242692 RepID=UPI00359DB8DC
MTVAAPRSSLPLRGVLATPILAGAEVMAGAGGLGRIVTRLNVMEVPDVLAFVKPDELLLTTGYPLRDRPDALPRLIADLDDRGLAGLGVKLGRYLDAIPGAALDEADRRGFPVVRLPEGVAFDDILNDVLGAMLDRQARQLERAERVHQAFLQVVLRGEGVEQIARDLAELLDGPAAVVDRDGTVLGAARLADLGLADVDDPAPMVIAQDDRHVRVDGTQLPCVAVPIVAGPRKHGHVVAITANGSRTGDLLALESAATVAALVLTQRMELRAVESKYQSDLVHDLLRGAGDVDDVRRRAAGFGWDLDRRLIAIVLRLDERVDDAADARARPPLAGSLRGSVLERDPGAAVVQFSSEVVVLTAAFDPPPGTDAPDGRAEACAFAADLAARAGRAAGVSASAGLSRPVVDVREVARAYEQASRAVELGREISGRAAVTHFDDLGAYRLLALVPDRDELRAFAVETLRELAADDPAALDLRQTLQALLDSGGNVAEAARRLHFHYNTLRYRIEKLESILGPFMTDARRRLDVQLALLVLRLHPHG